MKKGKDDKIRKCNQSVQKRTGRLCRLHFNLQERNARQCNGVLASLDCAGVNAEDNIIDDAWAHNRIDNDGDSGKRKETCEEGSGNGYGTIQDENTDIRDTSGNIVGGGDGSIISRTVQLAAQNFLNDSGGTIHCGPKANGVTDVGGSSSVGYSEISDADLAANMEVDWYLNSNGWDEGLNMGNNDGSTILGSSAAAAYNGDSGIDRHDHKDYITQDTMNRIFNTKDKVVDGLRGTINRLEKQVATLIQRIINIESSSKIENITMDDSKMPAEIVDVSSESVSFAETSMTQASILNCPPGSVTRSMVRCSCHVCNVDLESTVAFCVKGNVFSCSRCNQSNNRLSRHAIGRLPSANVASEPLGQSSACVPGSCCVCRVCGLNIELRGAFSVNKNIFIAVSAKLMDGRT
jgi:hypothetical protein